MLEIERKWILKNKNDLDKLKELLKEYKCIKHAEIEQSYLYSFPTEIRLRKTHDLSDDTNSYYLDVKSNGTKVRNEISNDIKPAQYKELCSLIPYHVIKKIIMFIYYQAKKNWSLALLITELLFIWR